MRHTVPTFAVLAATFLLVSCATRVPEWPMPEGTVSTTINGYPIAHKGTGAGPVIVALPGVMCDYRCFGPQSTGLADGYRFVAVSLRHAYPEKWDGTGTTYSLAQHAHDVASLIEKLGAPVYLVGQSYGARVAYEVAHARPELVRKLVLAEAPIDSMVVGASEVLGIQRERAIKTEALFRTSGIDAGLEFGVDAINGDGLWARLPPPVKQLARDNAWTVVALGKDDWRPVSCSEFAELKMPVLIVSGERTAPRFKQLVAEQAKCLPGAQLKVIPRAGHNSQFDNSADFNAAVRAFLR